MPRSFERLVSSPAFAFLKFYVYASVMNETQSNRLVAQMV
jgi:hypothetical protein